MKAVKYTLKFRFFFYCLVQWVEIANSFDKLKTDSRGSNGLNIVNSSEKSRQSLTGVFFSLSFLIISLHSVSFDLYQINPQSNWLSESRRGGCIAWWLNNKFPKAQVPCRDTGWLSRCVTKCSRTSKSFERMRCMVICFSKSSKQLLILAPISSLEASPASGTISALHWEWSTVASFSLDQEIDKKLSNSGIEQGFRFKTQTILLTLSV